MKSHPSLVPELALEKAKLKQRDPAWLMNEAKTIALLVEKKYPQLEVGEADTSPNPPELWINLPLAPGLSGRLVTVQFEDHHLHGVWYHLTMSGSIRVPGSPCRGNQREREYPINMVPGRDHLAQALLKIVGRIESALKAARKAKAKLEEKATGWGVKITTKLAPAKPVVEAPSPNKVILIGRLSQDPKVYDAGLVRFVLAVQEMVPTSPGHTKETTQWFDCSAWREVGRKVMKLTAGTRVALDGRLQQTRTTSIDLGQGGNRVEIEVRRCVEL
jgi:hypothetical protein